MTAARSDLEILSLIGSGGFGRVYRGRLTTEGGFSQDVAIKLLRGDRTTPVTIARLRDEARTLLLLRDRAIVSARPPVRLGEDWAVLMEYVDGFTARELVRSGGCVPPVAALEIVGEVARALDAAYHQLGPDGVPLRLVHRDIKTANLQITRSAEVKILDFGAAVAEFTHREVHTETHLVVGTAGYVAPERFRGDKGPAGDVYALGVTLHELVTGEHPGAADSVAEPALEDVLAFVTEMTDPDPRLRPTARQVQDQCRFLAQILPGPPLAEWVRRLPDRPPLYDELVGQSFAMSTDPQPTVRGRDVHNGVLVALGATSALGLFGVGLLASTLFAVAVALVAGSGPDPSTVVPPLEEQRPVLPLPDDGPPPAALPAPPEPEPPLPKRPPADIRRSR